MKLSLVIPAYNEAAVIEATVRGLRDAFAAIEPSFEIIVVQNGSKDATPAVLARLSSPEIPELVIVPIAENRGYGNGVLRGLGAAHGEILGWVDADNQVPPQDVCAVYRAVRDGPADLAKARRRSRPESYFRAIQSIVFNAVFWLLFGGTVRDINAKPKFFRRSLGEAMQLVSLDFFIDSELMIKAIRQKNRIVEVEVSWSERAAGTSSISLTAGLEFLKNMIRYRFSKK